MDGPVARWAAVTVDCVDPERASAFWGQLLDVPPRPVDGLPGWFRIGPTAAGGPVVTFQPVPEPKRGKTRIHFDLVVDDLEHSQEKVIGLGGCSLNQRHDYAEGIVVVMADPEGNEFCLVRYVD